MSRADRVRPAPLAGVISRHEIVAKDPRGAIMLNSAIMDHITPTTQASYASALKKYLVFCDARDVVPFPVDPVWIALYITVVTSSIKTRLSMDTWRLSTTSKCYVGTHGLLPRTKLSDVLFGT